MPLIIPGITSKGTDADKWSHLIGKKPSDDEVPNDHPTLFSKQKLPEEHRIIAKDGFVTQDFKENRLNIQLRDDGTVDNVYYDGKKGLTR